MIEFASGLVLGLLLGWLLTVFSESFRQRIENSITTQRWWLQQDLARANQELNKVQVQGGVYTEKLEKGWRLWAKFMFYREDEQVNKMKLKFMDLTCWCPNCEQPVPHDTKVLEQAQSLKLPDGGQKAETGRRRSPSRPKAQRV